MEIVYANSSARYSRLANTAMRPPPVTHRSKDVTQGTPNGRPVDPADGVHPDRSDESRRTGMDLATGVVARCMSDFNTQIIEEFRANDGRVGGNFAGANLVLMTTVGARSGVERTTPVVYFTDADRIYVIASAGGSTKHPAWYH